MPFDPKNPTKTHESYSRLCELSRLPSDLLGGLPALLERKSTYFPREPMELAVVGLDGKTVDPYENRIGRLRLDNRFKDGVDRLLGRVFRRSIVWSDDVPPRIRGDETTNGLVDDVDGRGTSASIFLYRRCRMATAKGVECVLVDPPRTPDAGRRSVEDERSAGLRPYWRPYSREAVLDWDHAHLRGARRLSYLKLADSWTDPATGEVLPALRVLTADGVHPVRFEIWVTRKAPAIWRVLWSAVSGADPSTWTKVDEGERNPQVDIPFVPYSTGAEDPLLAEPQLIDAAYQQLAHCRKTNSLDNGQHVVGFPRAFASGISLQEFKAQMEEGHSARNFWCLPQPGGQVGFAEPAGTSWNAVEATIERLEKQIDRAMDEPVQRDSSQPLTAQGEANSESAVMSRLEKWVKDWQDATNLLLYFTAVDLGEVKPTAEKGWGEATFNTKWTRATRDVDVVRFAYEQVAAGRWPEELAWQIAQEHGVVPEEVTFKELQKMVGEQAVTAPRLLPLRLPIDPPAPPATPPAAGAA